ITRNSRGMRALGLGYADLGALIMALGLPYDSDEGRAWASTITAMMTGEAYVQSARIASVRRPFSEFQENREAMLRVIQEHRKEVHQITPIGVPEELVAQAGKAWDLAL